MFTNALAAAIDTAHPKQFDYLSRQLWQAHAAGHIADQDAQSLAERLHSRRGDSGVAQGAVFRLASGVTPARGQNAPRGILRTPERKSPDRRRSIERRRTLAATWPMPPAMAAELTTCQVAFARILSDEVKHKGRCDRTLYEIAARGGMCRKTAKRAQARLVELGWIIVVERPVSGRKHLANVIRIVSPEWQTWIERGPRRRTGGQKCPTTENHLYSYAGFPADRPARGFSRKEIARSSPPDAADDRRRLTKETGQAIPRLYRQENI